MVVVCRIDCDCVSVAVKRALERRCDCPRRAVDRHLIYAAVIALRNVARKVITRVGRRVLGVGRIVVRCDFRAEIERIAVCVFVRAGAYDNVGVELDKLAGVVLLPRVYAVRKLVPFFLRADYVRRRRVARRVVAHVAFVTAVDRAVFLLIRADKHVLRAVEEIQVCPHARDSAVGVVG